MAATAMAPTIRSSFRSAKDVEAAMLEKLKESCLKKVDAKLLHLEPFTATDVSKRLSSLPVHRAGFRIPYFDLSGRETKFFRFRYLEYGTENGFAALVADQLKKLRYAQPPGTVNEIYLPPCGDVVWSEVAKDATKPIVITEGELKAACATSFGLATIGLGGVYCFKSAKEGLALLPAFEAFAWKDRPVFIAYDSDAVTNPMVVAAENALARELLSLEARVHITRIPALETGKKTGLDDYIYARGISDFSREVLMKSEEWSKAKELFALNEEVLYVADPGLIIRLDTLQKMSPRAFVEHAYADRLYQVQEVTANGMKMTEKSAPREWIRWTGRNVVPRVTYLPGASRITPTGELNLWKGWGTEPKKGDVRPWTELLDYLFRDTPPAERRWFEQWLAYPLQYPGTKLYSAVVLWGLIHGTGKSLVGYTMFQLYGQNATEIGDRDLYSAHNEWAEHKQFVMGDEITGGDKRSSADRMKSMITQKMLRLNPKYIPSYTVPDCINYYFTSNHPDAFFLEDTDRRFFIHEVQGKPLPSEFYASYMRWLSGDTGTANGTVRGGSIVSGASALFHYLLSLDLTGFNPQGHAPYTRSKGEMIDNGRSDLGAWVATLRDYPDQVLKLGDKVLPYRLWTTTELFRLYDPEAKGKVTMNGLSRELRRAGFVKVYDGMPILTRAGQQKLWAARGTEGLPKTRAAFGELYDRERASGKGRKF